VLVSSGAIAEGMQRLGWSSRPRAIHELQAAAAVGQMGLVQAYEAAFSQYGLRTAQVLLTHDDLADRRRYLNARTTLTTLIGLGVIPVINENDTVTTDEIRLGDNDTLGALVTNLIEADVLVLLTDQTGLYTKDPRRHSDAELSRRRQRNRCCAGKRRPQQNPIVDVGFAVEIQIALAERDIVAADQQDLAELDDLARLSRDLLDLDHIFGGNPVLLAAGSDDCEHRSRPRVRFRYSAQAGPAS